MRRNTIRISGYDIPRLSKASEFVLEQVIQVWFSPAYIDATREEAIEYLIGCAKATEQLRKKDDDLIFDVGCEYSLFLKGFIRGDTIYERLGRMFNPSGIILNILGFRKRIYNELNLFLRDTTEKVREHFKGKLSYASGTWQ
jgi:hypothetical protein